ncbi:MAG: tetratricopeptide repeat protein [Chloroflexi bacterium]|nr:tetratricopeptide repeat protein [Chloroflexota bacterium]
MPCPFLGSQDDREKPFPQPSAQNACYAVTPDAERPLLSRLHLVSEAVSPEHQSRYCLNVEYPFCPRYLAFRKTQAANRTPARRGAAAPPPAAAPTPPPTESEGERLYREGMTHYRARQWEQARAAFSRLKEIEPGRPGIDALLDEAKLFIQLQNMESEAPDEPPAPQEEATPVDAPVPLDQARRRPRWLQPAWLAVTVVVLAVFGFLGLHLAGVPILSGSQDERTDLYNQGRALLVVGDYDGAIAKFEQLLSMDPGNQEAQAELERAQRLRALEQLYGKAKRHIDAAEWDEADQTLQQILQLDANYRDAATLAAEVDRQKRFFSLYTEGKALYDQGDWPAAAARFEELHTADASYRREVVEEYLFVCYLNHGLSLVVNSGDSVERIREAVRQFSAALSIHPRNQQAAEEQRLANLYLSGYTSYQQQEWQQALIKVQQVFETRSDYAGGRAAQVLCSCYVAMGDQARAGGDLMRALEHYRSGLAHEGLQCPPAQDREQETLRILYPPTPTPEPATPTPAPTDTPLVPPTPTATATSLVVVMPTPSPTDTPWAPTATAPPPPPPTRDRPPTNTPVPPTHTPRPPTNTPRPPTNTPRPPTPTPPR